jgi:hypothetical protein
MENVSRNIILDLLPAYIAGEASEESQILIEEFAKNDPEIADLISRGKLESETISSKISVPDDLEMKTMKRIHHSIRRRMLYAVLATALILMIPFVAMLFTNEVNWSLFDFILMGILLFGSGLTYVLISGISDNTAYRIATGVAVAAGLILVWLNLAVGIIGSENNPANLLYLGVLAVGFTGALVSRFRARGMARTLFTTAIVQMLVPVIAIIIWKSTLEGPPGVAGVFILNAIFAAMFVASAFLFRRAAKDGKS